MAKASPDKAFFHEELIRVESALKKANINNYAVLVHFLDPTLKQKDIYNVIHRGHGKKKWAILKKIGELVGVEIDEPSEEVAA